MDKDTKTIILAVFVILIIAVMGIMFAGSGYVTKEPSDSYVEVNPTIAYPGQNVEINVYPGVNGVAKGFTIRRVNGLRAAQSTLHCSSYCCREDFTEIYKLPSNWDGDFYMEFEDCRGNTEKVTADFEVVS